MLFIRGTELYLILTAFACLNRLQAAPAQSTPVEMTLTSTSQTSEDFLSEVASRLSQVYIQPQRPQLRSTSVPRIIFERLKKKLSRERGNAKIAPTVLLSAPHSSPGSLSPQK